MFSASFAVACKHFSAHFFQKMIFPLDVTLQIRVTWLIPSLTGGFWTVMPSRSGHAGVPLLLTESTFREGSGTLKGEHGFLLSQGTWGVSALLCLSFTEFQKCSGAQSVFMLILNSCFSRASSVFYLNPSMSGCCMMLLQCS